MTHKYSIKGMHCSKCEARIKSELLQLGDITHVEISFRNASATISMLKHISLEQLQAAVQKAGDYSIQEDPVQGAEIPSAAPKALSYFPVYLIFVYITIIITVPMILRGAFSWVQWMSHFMAGFFLIFSFFKFLNLRGFAEGFRTYDLVTARFPVWGYLYPFAELGLGISFLIGFQPLLTASLTFLIMAISSLGVINSLRSKRTIQCACLGTVIQVPLGTLSLIEDLLMVVMSGWMLWMHI